MDVIIVCHTEFGFVKNNKVIASKNAVSGVKDGVSNLIKIVDKYGAKVTFAVMPEVVDYFPKNIVHEIGLHIHPGWKEFREDGVGYMVGDSYLKSKCKQSSVSTILRDYSYEEQLGLISAGKNYIFEKLNVMPKVFVAGRWSINNDTIKALVESDMTHECSACAHAKPSHYDWSQLPRICMPYHPNKDDYQKAGNSHLLVLPISQYFPVGNINPEAIPNVGLDWLKACFLEYYEQGAPFFHICIHSPSMTDPYLFTGMDNFISFISGHKNISFKFASEIGQYDSIKLKKRIRPYLFAINKNIIKAVFKKILGINERYSK